MPVASTTSVSTWTSTTLDTSERCGGGKEGLASGNSSSSPQEQSQPALSLPLLPFLHARQTAHEIPVSVGGQRRPCYPSQQRGKKTLPKQARGMRPPAHQHPPLSRLLRVQVGMRYFTLNKNKYHNPIVNLDKLWSLVGEEVGVCKWANLQACTGHFVCFKAPSCVPESALRRLQHCCPLRRCCAGGC
jgi:hypothetical protein